MLPQRSVRLDKRPMSDPEDMPHEFHQILGLQKILRMLLLLSSLQEDHSRKVLT